ncbi:hypothetical protein [Arthrobacter mobilis]|uniref:Uncharacterized protein n=1 Tax=Arthrobacter mobilis TaxID=2724944 RepID=A0A7X6HFX7_9MICC|nr:hypothetical protein [Arthrobacter mobilis]NKX55296.1 hypothetical protein [Arthrobacter mobilis]
MDAREDFDALLYLLSVTRNEAIRPPLAADVEVSDPDGKRTDAVARVDGHTGSWRLEEDGCVTSYSPGEGLVFRDADGSAESLGHERNDWMPQPVQLFYPLRMRIWGGFSDDLRITGAKRRGDDVLLSLVYLEDAEYHASALFSSKYGVVTEFRTPSGSWLLRRLRTDIPGPDAT